MSPGKLVNTIIDVIEAQLGETLFHAERPLSHHAQAEIFRAVDEFRKAAINRHMVEKLGCP